MLETLKDVAVLSIAGGNVTALGILDEELTREEYEKLGSDILQVTADQNVEQVGFVIPNKNKLEMAGGEFCGNATAAAAVVLSKLNGQDSLELSVSGYPEKVRASVTKNDDRSDAVETFFPIFNYKLERRSYQQQEYYIVDLGGIVHIVSEEKFIAERAIYERKLKELVKVFGLEKRDAVGVIWIHEEQMGININPVVWVKSIDTCFYETSCGSGSIAAAIVTTQSDVHQPSGDSIDVRQSPDKSFLLKSQVRILSGNVK